MESMDGIVAEVENRKVVKVGIKIRWEIIDLVATDVELVQVRHVRKFITSNETELIVGKQQGT